MSRTQLSALWWFLAAAALAVTLIGYKDIVGWLDASKQLDNERVDSVIAFWALVLGGFLVTFANLVGTLVSLRASGAPWQQRIPDWPLGFLKDSEADDRGRWDWKLFKALGFFVGAILPWLVCVWHAAWLVHSWVVDTQGNAHGRFFQFFAHHSGTLRIGAPNGDEYIPFVTPAVAIVALVLATVTLACFADRVWFKKGA